jgi:tripartite-type tricarboxylate transporter receptor subunit TctC
VIGEKLTPRLRQTVMIDNRPGAGGNIGMEIVARAPADGHTMVLAMVGSWAMNPHLYKLPYDVVGDFAPIILVATMPGVLAVHPSVPAKTVKEYIALARQRPGELTYGTAGVGTFAHVSGELLAVMTGVKLTHVPYKGSGPMLPDLVGGHIHSSFESITPILPHITSGRVRALATTGAVRSQVLPDLPTIAEAGVPGFDNPTWAAIGAPARTPRPVIERLNEEINAILQMPEFKDAIRTAGGNITGGTPEQFRDYLKSELAKFGKLIKETGMKAGG